MIFKDEEQRKEFHSSNSILQMLVHNFESLCFEHGVQVELVEVRSDYAVTVHAGLKDEAALYLVDQFNSLYERSDRQESLSLVNLELGIFQVFADSSRSFKTLT